VPGNTKKEKLQCLVTLVGENLTLYASYVVKASVCGHLTSLKAPDLRIEVISWSTGEEDYIFRIETEQTDEAFLHCTTDSKTYVCHIYVSVLYMICAIYR